MSKTRLAIRALLLLIILGMVWVGYQQWSKSKPDYYWKKAQAAANAGDHEAAALYLQNLVQQFPDHAEGHKLLAKTYLALAATPEQSASYATHERAFNHLKEAARLREDDLESQKQLLAAYLQSRQMNDAAQVAALVEKLDPDNVDALYALTWRAVDKKQTNRAEQLFEKLRNLQSSRVFQTYALQAQLYQDTEDDPKLQETLAQIVAVAGDLKADQFGLLSRRDLSTLADLLPTTVQRAPDLDSAHKRAAAALTACETLSGAELLGLDEVSEAASRIAMLAASRALLADADDEARATRNELIARAEAIGTKAIAAGKVPPIVYRQVALGEFSRNDPEAGLVTIRKGLVAGEDLPDAEKRGLLGLHELAAQQLVKMQRFSEAKPHLEAMIADEATAGSGYLLSGSVAMAEGRQEKALDNYLRAGQQLGRTLMVRMALAQAYVSLNRWQEALVEFKAINTSIAQMTEPQRDWMTLLWRSPESLRYAQLVAHLAVGQWDEAQPHLAVLKGSSFEPNAWALAIGHMWNNQQRAEASVLLSDLRRQFPGSHELLVLDVKILLADGKTAEVGPLLEKFAAGAPEDLKAQLILGRWYLSQDQPQQAVKHLDNLPESSVKSDSDKQVVTLLKAQSLLAAKQPEEALALVEPLLKDPRTAAAAGVVGAAAELGQNNLNAAIDTLTEASAAAPTSATLGMLLGQIAQAQGDYETAIDKLAIALDATKLRPRAEDAMLKSILLLARQKSPAEAEAKLEQLLVSFPENVGLLLAKADLVFQQNRFEEGLSYLDHVERLQPGNPTPVFFKAIAWQRQDIQRTLEEAKRALKIDPKHIPSLVLAAQASVAIQQNSAAIGFAQTALKLNPNLWFLTILQAEALDRLERTGEAIELLDSFTQSYPKMAGGYLALAALYGKAGETEPALDILRKQRAEFSDDFRFVSAEVTLLAKADRLEDAKRVAEEAVSSEPAWEKCLTLASTFAAESRFEEARSWGQRALAEADGKDEVLKSHLLLGDAALQQLSDGTDDKLLAESRDHFAAVLESEPSHLVAGNNLAWLLATRLDEPEQALKIVEDVRGDAKIEHLPLNFIDTLAVVYRVAKRLDEAQAVLETATVNWPNQPKLLFQLGQVYADQDKSDEARRTLERALHLGLSGVDAEAAKQQLQRLLENAEKSP